MAKSTRAAVNIDFVLRRIFKKKSFRPHQREIIEAALSGHDVFVQAATSFGKSLCYQLPAVVDHGITICISPLLSLMRDQILQLEAADIKVATINSGISYGERDAILEDLRCGHPRTRLLFVTPEFCLSESFRRHLRTIYGQHELARIAIDEAHCISEWGHDFRSSYLQLSFFRTEFPDTPIICLTATATRDVREDVISVLKLDVDKLKIFTTTTARPNLHYDVQFICEHDDVRFAKFVAWYRGVQGRRADDTGRRSELDGAGERLDAVSGIIYTSTRDGCDTLADRLRSEGLGAAAYHAGLKASEREDCQTKWLANGLGHDIIVATTAFGMGIDKVDVRFVVHWNLPKSFEGFYQEAGRAGRDGRASLCTLFYSREDAERVEYRVRETAEKKGKGSGGSGASEAGARGRGRGRASRGGGGGGGGHHHDQELQNAAAAAAAKAKTGMLSFRKLIEYCESTDRCRHRMITEYFGEQEEPEKGEENEKGKGEGGKGGGKAPPLPPSTAVVICDHACDFCKEGRAALVRRKDAGLAGEAPNLHPPDGDDSG